MSFANCSSVACRPDRSDTRTCLTATAGLLGQGFAKSLARKGLLAWKTRWHLVFSSPSTREREPWIPTMHPLGALLWESPLWACLRHGLADNCGMRVHPGHTNLIGYVAKC